MGSHRLVTSEGFELFAHPHMAAEEFGAGAAYGYGIAMDQLDGHKRLRHTGGMVSFASALQVDLDSGVGRLREHQRRAGLSSQRPSRHTRFN